MNCLHPINTDPCCSCGTGEVIYEGTTPKYRVEIDVGVPMTDFEFQVQLIGNAGTLTIPKAQMSKDSENKYYMTFDTTRLGIGNVKAIVNATIGASGFPNNTRKEVYKIENLFEIRRP